MADKLVYKGGATVVGHTGSEIELVLPANGALHRFPRWWNKKGTVAYIDAAIFKVKLDSGTVVRLVVPTSIGAHTLEIRHDGFGNFTFPVCRVDRVAVVAEDSTDLLVEYQFSKISGGSVLKRIIGGIPTPPPPEPEVLSLLERHPEVEAAIEDLDTTEDADPVEEADAVDLDSMTKQQLLDWAMDQGHDLVDHKLKAEILSECKEILATD